MAPFTAFPLIEGFKERVECLATHGDKLYLGTNTGNLHVYGVENGANGTPPVASPVEVRTRFTRRSIEHLGFIKDINSMVLLTEASIYLYSMPGLGSPTLLPQTKGAAITFAVDVSVQHIPPSTILSAISHSDAEEHPSEGVPTVVSTLAVGCRKRIVIYSWRDGEAQPPKELSLPHSPRAMVFPDPNNIFLSSVSDHVVLALPTMSLTEVVLPTASSITSVPGMGGLNVPGMSALSGLGGYMTLGMGSKSKPVLVKIGEGEVALAKDSGMLFYGMEGKPSRDAVLDWPAPPEDAAGLHPYVISILPTGTNTSPASPAVNPTSAQQTPPSQPIQMRSTATLNPVQTLQLPFKTGAPTVGQNVRLIHASSSSKPPVFLVSTSTDKAATNIVWSLVMQSWAEQLDELIGSLAYVEALALLNVLPTGALPDKDERVHQVKTLRAVQLFSEKKFNEAIDAFLELDTNPALVVGLYPEDVSGPLAIPRKAWIEVFGGTGSLFDSDEGDAQKEKVENEGDTASITGTKTDDTKGSITGRLMAGLEGLVPIGGKDDDSTTVKSRPKPDEYQRSLESLLRYLPDRRQKVIGAFSAQSETPSTSPPTSLFSTHVSVLQSLPSIPPSRLEPSQLLQVAQIVDTALFKSYLIVRPGLIGALCRLPSNWCEVSEVETELKGRKKYADLIDLYRGKKMHGKALQLLHELSEGEDDQEIALGPTIRYLQRLGVQYLDVIFDSSQWVFAASPTLALEIFTADLDEVDSLPRKEVAAYLQRIDASHESCIRYLEHLMSLGEEDVDLNELLAELYLEKAEKGQDDAYGKLLRFIEDSDKYRPDRLLSRLPSEGLFEARAILLGRLGRHEGALQIYVYRLSDYAKAELYCKRIQSEKPDIFLTLLRLYLAPAPPQPFLLAPALSLIAHHSIQLDPLSTLSLLPPLVPARDVSRFLGRALRDERRWSKVEKEVRKARGETVAYDLVRLQERRVRIGDSRICPQCQKRLGNSVIAVHAPRGEVTHYQCREAFSRKLAGIR